MADSVAGTATNTTRASRPLRTAGAITGRAPGSCAVATDTEQSLRKEDESHDQKGISHQVLPARGKEFGGDALGHAENEGTDHRAGDAAQSPHDHRDERL